MRQAGCWEVAMGLESGSQSILDNLKKGTTVEQGGEACRLAYALGFSVRPSGAFRNEKKTRGGDGIGSWERWKLV